MEELIDILDENGNKTGKIETRKQVHEKGLWHRIIVVSIIDRNGHLLMHKGLLIKIQILVNGMCQQQDMCQVVKLR